MSSTPSSTPTTDRRASDTPGLDPERAERPDLPTPITADEVTMTPPDRTPHPAPETTDVSLTFERS